MKIGDRVSARPQTFGKEHMEGEVVWIHPQGRFALVEFTFEPNGPTWLSRGKLARIRECFHLIADRQRDK